jgi:hypothetical protein
MSEIKVDTLTGKTTANDITVTVGATATQSLEQGLAKATARANAAASLLDSNGVSSGVDNGTGNYTYTLTNAMSDLNFVVCATASASGSKNAVFLAQSASSFDVETFTTSSDANADSQHSFAVHGDLA